MNARLSRRIEHTIIEFLIGSRKVQARENAAALPRASMPPGKHIAGIELERKVRAEDPNASEQPPTFLERFKPSDRPKQAKSFPELVFSCALEFDAFGINSFILLVSDRIKSTSNERCQAEASRTS
jgi:hypothetical protein